MKRRHHYVPRFYLKAFASAPKRIHVLNLARARPIPNASLRDQCYADRLYGPDDTLEDAFGGLEGLAASVIAGMRTVLRPPAPGGEEHDALCVFLATQLERTTGAVACLLGKKCNAVRLLLQSVCGN